LDKTTLLQQVCEHVGHAGIGLSAPQCNWASRLIVAFKLKQIEWSPNTRDCCGIETIVAYIPVHPGTSGEEARP